MAGITRFHQFASVRTQQTDGLLSVEEESTALHVEQTGTQLTTHGSGGVSNSHDQTGGYVGGYPTNTGIPRVRITASYHI